MLYVYTTIFLLRGMESSPMPEHFVTLIFFIFIMLLTIWVRTTQIRCLPDPRHNKTKFLISIGTAVMIGTVIAFIWGLVIDAVSPDRVIRWQFRTGVKQSERLTCATIDSKATLSCSEKEF